MNRIPVSLHDFCEGLEARVERSPKKFYRRKPVPSSPYADPDLHIEVETVDGVAIHIPDHRVDDFLRMLDDRQLAELEIREKYPALQQAYERYQMLLALCGFDKNARY